MGVCAYGMGDEAVAEYMIIDSIIEERKKTKYDCMDEDEE